MNKWVDEIQNNCLTLQCKRFIYVDQWNFSTFENLQFKCYVAEYFWKSNESAIIDFDGELRNHYLRSYFSFVKLSQLNYWKNIIFVKFS